MNFGEWLKHKRAESGLSLVALAEIAATTGATINRIENQKAEPQFFTAITIAQALGGGINEFCETFVGKSMAIERAETRDSAWLTSDDAFHLMRIMMQQNPLAVFDFLAEGFNVINERLGEDLQFEGKSLHRRLMTESPIYGRLEIAYPPSPANHELLDIYRSGGVLTMADVGSYIKNMRSQSEMTLVKMEEETGVADHIIQRIESGAVANMRMVDAVKLAQHIDGGEMLFAIAWTASEFDALVAQKAKAVDTAIYTLIKLFRWLAHLGLETEYREFLARWRGLLMQMLHGNNGDAETARHAI